MVIKKITEQEVNDIIQKEKIDLSSFEVRSTLNPKIFDGDQPNFYYFIYLYHLTLTLITIFIVNNIIIRIILFLFINYKNNLKYILIYKL